MTLSLFASEQSQSLVDNSSTKAFPFHFLDIKNLFDFSNMVILTEGQAKPYENAPLKASGGPCQR